MNYFELFNLPESFDVDLAGVAETYQTLQRLTHPDKFAGGSEQQKLLAVQKNAQVNDAYTMLKSPLRRAEYLLELRGFDLQHEQQTVKDTQFLMQQMEWREELAEIAYQSDPLDALEALDDTISQEISKELRQLASYLAQNGNQQAAELVRKLKFLYKMRTEIALKEEALSDV
ncbi:co-chaperone HscB [Paraglaciecola aquimarina]|uniref:Co-chaperone protein HscB homolog n=1 Tax=Paraglaciecola aquimarina TaxID=1235557 RepID=A0ABU3T1J8_9ALTE|nr:co-chaperone HscB [Paraglaciecola aquimarina]MDU0356155.1 co-chaperone HscB [Paraglaciecola aquimarina]